jgi:xylulokinase
MNCVLALDAGTTSMKGALFDAEGRGVAVAAMEYSPAQPGPDLVELDAELYWRAAAQVTRDLLASPAASGARVLSAGVTSQGETLIVTDGAGRALRPAIVWLDNRSGAEAREIEREFGIETIHRVTGQQEMAPTWTATRALWMRRHEPELFRKAARFLLVEDYLILRLTGRAATDRALCPSTLYYDLQRGEWWPEMLRFVGLSAEQLPELKSSGEVAGAVTPEAAALTGLPAGIPVTTAPIDQIAGAVGAGNLEPGTITETTGAALALCATTEGIVYDPLRRVGTYAHALPGRFALLPWTPTAGMLLRWFRNEFGAGRGYEELVREAAGVPPGAGGVTLLPHFCGAGSPRVDPRARGALAGLSLGHGRAHVARAILESVAFMARENLEMLDALGAPAREVRCLGGAARSATWMQIKADVCGRDLIVMECEEAAALGAAMISFVGNGTYPSLHAASAAMARVRGRVAHNPALAPAYDAAYCRYLDLDREIR